MAVTILKNTHQEVVARLDSSDTNNTISLAALSAVGQEVPVGATPIVNIVGITWAGAPAASITITRNAVEIFTLPCDGAAFLDFSGQDMVPETTQNTQDIAATFTGSGQVWLKLRKVGGFQTQVEDATYGAYDDPTRVGASTTMSGSPDKV